jgi:DNA-binding Lrp family transcriptional regulator
MPADLDSLDWKLIHVLTREAGDLARVADEVGCDEAEVSGRLFQLREKGVVGEVVARVAPATVGLPITAFYLLRVAQNEPTYEAVEKLLRDIDQVEEAHAVSGQFDWLVKVRAQSVDDLQRLLTQKLALLPGFVRAETMVVLTTACDHVNVHAATHPLGA